MAGKGRAMKRRQERTAASSDVRALSKELTGDVLMQTAWCEDDDKLELVKQVTHDAVIESLGASRTSVVHWMIHHTTPGEFRAGDAAFDLLEHLIASGSPELLAQVYRPIRGLLREHGGYLVVAMASGAQA